MKLLRILGTVALGVSAVVFLPTAAIADDTATTFSLTGIAASVVAPISLSGDNTAGRAPTLNVTMPAGALADSYSGTVTTSLL